VKQTIELPAGYCLEFWARGPGSLRICDDQATLWQAPSFGSHVDFYRYHHAERSTVAIEWERADAVLWAYGYEPDSVVTSGITVWEFGDDHIVLRSGDTLAAWMRADLDRPLYHFSPIRQWMNDPNGLCRIGDTWHVFYQFHPASTEWGPMHWGHAVSTDLFHWTHLPVFLHPEQNYWRLGATGGAFSGSAFVDRTGDLMFFFTERLPAYDLKKGYREIQKLARPDKDAIGVRGVETVISTRPTEDGVEHDFRDPKVWWDEAAGAYRMVLGSALDGDPAVLLYGSENLTNWRYIGPLYRAPAHYRLNGARAAECPDFFPLDGRWVLVMGLVGYTEPSSGRHNLLLALVGDFIGDRFVPHTGDPQILDFGTDFYALQSFHAAGRRIAFSWVFNWEDRKPPGSPYSGEMALPRELRVDEKGRLAMLPVPEFERAYPKRQLATASDGTYAVGNAPLDLRLVGDLNDTHVVASQNGQLSFEIEISADHVAVRLDHDDGNIVYRGKCKSPTDLRVIFDRGILEIFADNGAVCGTRRSYANIAPDTVRVTTRAQARLELFATT